MYLLYFFKEILLFNVFLVFEFFEIYMRFILEKGGYSVWKKFLILLSFLEYNVYYYCDNFLEENEMC